ncbi:CYTH domain-containing protein, partial [Priestia megaterium]
MKQEIEIEFKNIVTKEEFDRLRSHFQLTEDQFVSQENHYFDTPAF